MIPQSCIENGKETSLQINTMQFFFRAEIDRKVRQAGDSSKLKGKVKTDMQISTMK